MTTEPSSEGTSIDHINKRIWELWGRKRPIVCQTDERVKQILGLVPKFVFIPRKRARVRKRLLVVGLNPSFREDRYRVPEAFHRWMKYQNPNLVYPNKFKWTKSIFEKYRLFSEKPRRLAKAMGKMHYQARWYYTTHFGRINQIARSLGLDIQDYVYLDLYLWQRVDTYVPPKRRYGKWLQTQECIFFSLLKKVQPNMILCLYPRAGRILLSLCNKKSSGITVGKSVRRAGDRLEKTMLSLRGKDVPLVVPRQHCVPNGRRQFNGQDFRKILKSLKALWDRL